MLFRIFTFGVAGVIGVTLGSWAIEREPATVMRRMEVITPEVQPGGRLRIHYFVTRYKDCMIKIDRSIHDSQKVRYVLPDLDFTRGPGPLGEDDYVSETVVPNTLAEGPAFYRATTRYQCNPLHRFWPIVVGPIDLYFTIKGEPLPMPVVVPVETVPPR